MINHGQPNSSANVDEHVPISLSTYRWDDDVIFKNCARDDDCNKVRTYCVCVQSEQCIMECYLTMYLSPLKQWHVHNHSDLQQGRLNTPSQ